jgi:lysophospholipase
MDVPTYKVAAGRLTSRFLPEFSLPSGIKGVDLTRDPAMVALQESDPLSFDLASSRWFTETMAAQKQALEMAPRFSLPLFCLQAGADKIAKPSATRAFFARLNTSQKTYRELEGRYHELMNDIGRSEVIDQFAEAILGAYSATLKAAPDQAPAPTTP